MMKRTAYAVGALALAAALVLLAAPALVDRPKVQAEIQQRLSEMLQGQVAWEALDVALFPAPHGELRKLRVEIPGKIAAAADDVNVYLRLWPLLRGRAEISSLTLKKPSVRVFLDGSGGDAPLDAVAARVRSRHGVQAGRGYRRDRRRLRAARAAGAGAHRRQGCRAPGRGRVQPVEAALARGAGRI
jgi:uncharacterized protein involved in outer membrane biogenesis